MFIKKLFLIRHSKSSWKHPGMSDHDRPLNKRGKYDAPFMAEKFYQLEIFPDLILSSTAVRTMEFANILADKLNYEKENIISLRELYLASDSEIIKTVRETDDKYKTIKCQPHPGGSEQTFQFEFREKPNIIKSPDCCKCINSNQHHHNTVNRIEIMPGFRKFSGWIGIN
jgi:phosphohistidine phosphatase